MRLVTFVVFCYCGNTWQRLCSVSVLARDFRAKAQMCIWTWSRRDALLQRADRVQSKVFHVRSVCAPAQYVDKIVCAILCQNVVEGIK